MRFPEIPHVEKCEQAQEQIEKFHLMGASMIDEVSKAQRVRQIATATGLNQAPPVSATFTASISIKGVYLFGSPITVRLPLSNKYFR